MTIRELRKKYLPRVAPEDFFVLLAHITQKTKVFLLAHPEYALSAEEANRMINALKRRARHEPVAYIVGCQEFYGRAFHVTPDTLIPRPETELLIEQVLDRIKTYDSGMMNGETVLDIIDVGTGSGNIIITLAKEIEKMHEIPSVQCYGLDISSKALAIAMKNAAYHTATKKILFEKSDLLRQFSCARKNNHHLIIIANLPYLSTALYHAAAPNVKNFEPRSALESGHDGLDHYRRLLREIKGLSVSSALTLFLEISPEQTRPLTEQILTVFPQAILVVFQDLSGKNRLIQASL